MSIKYIINLRCFWGLITASVYWNEFCFKAVHERILFWEATSVSLQSIGVGFSVILFASTIMQTI